MILDNVIERVGKLKEELDYLKECLWLRWSKWENKKTWKWTIKRRFLLRQKKSTQCRQTN